MVVRETIGRHVTWGTLVMGVSIVFCGLCGNAGAATIFTDGFEAPTLDPFWSTLEQSGSITFPSSAQVHGGSQAVQFNSTSSTGQKYIELYHEFATPVYGTFSVWMYDTGANYSSSNSLVFYVFDATSYASIAAFDYNSGDGAYYRGGSPVDGGFVSNISRTENWHEFSITAGADSVTYYVDNTLVHTQSSGMQIESLRFGMSGPTWRPAWTGYFDDFSAEFEAVPEPSAFVVCSSMGLCFLGIGWYRRRKRAV